MRYSISRRSFVVGATATASMAALGLAGCGAGATDGSETVEGSADATAETEATEEAEGVDTSAATYDDVDIEAATADEVQAILDGDDATTLLVDARPQEAYAGWAIDGAANGGHLAGALLYSARWLDCDYAGETHSRAELLAREMEDQGITADSSVIVYDYTGEQAPEVAKYLTSQGVASVKSFQANDLIDAGESLESFENYRYFVPPALVKSLSDVKTGVADALSDEAAAVFGDDVDNIVLVDVGWGNMRESSYYLTGHVPGAIHINTDCYERPRVYIPEKRSAYAKEWRLIPLEEFRDDVCTLYGITKDSVVVVTGAGLAPEARLSLMLRSLGVEVYCMSGLLTAWKYEGYSLDTDESTLCTPTSVDDFGSDEISNPDEILWMEDIEAILAGEIDGQVADNRGEDEWNGEYSGYSYHDLAGHIDGSIWCEESDNFENIDYTPRTPAEYTAYMEGCGLDTSKTIAFFCGDSWGAAFISYWCHSVDLTTVMQWGNGWIPWSNTGHEFVDHNGLTVHYDRWLDTVLDADGNDVRDGVNILDDDAGE